MKKNFLKKKKIFIGAAWPYANGSLHLGHIACLLSADILARYWRQKGSKVLFVSGADCYGTPITVTAEKQKTTPSKIAQYYYREFKKNLIKDLNFSYDLFSRTTSPFHHQVVQKIFLKLYQKGYIYKDWQTLPYCSHCQRFLPDRYIEGKCPHCGFFPARGDQCDECGALLDPRQLKKPYCKICRHSPIWKKTEHFFFKLSAFAPQLKKWIKKQTTWRKNAREFSLALLSQGLKDRPITRDTTWGVKIPLKGYPNKRIYVWFEAVCGYLSASQEWAFKNEKPKAWENFWKKPAYHYYIHAKDNIPFHTLIWPAILLAYGKLNLPNQIVSSEYLTLEGKQFSTSRNWAVWLPDFLKNFDSESLRYYLTINNPETADANFSWMDFQQKHNGELIGTLANFCHRVLSFSYKNFNRQIPLAQLKLNQKLLLKTKKTFEKSGQLIESAKFRESLKNILELAQAGNKFLEEEKPWTKIKENKEKAGQSLYIALQVVNNLRILIHPFLPQTSQQLGKFLNSNQLTWQFQLLKPKHPLKKPKPLFQPIKNTAIQEQIEKLFSNQSQLKKTS